MNTSTSIKECMNMPLVDFIQFYEEMARQMEQIAKQHQKGGA